MYTTYPTIDTEKTGENLRNMMLRRGLTVKDIQKFLGLSAPQGIYHWFNGRNLPSVDNLYALSELFHVSMDSLLVGNRDYRQKLILGMEKVHTPDYGQIDWGRTLLGYHRGVDRRGMINQES